MSAKREIWDFFINFRRYLGTRGYSGGLKPEGTLGISLENI